MPKRKYGKRSRKRSYKRRRTSSRRPSRRRLTSRNAPSGMPAQRTAILRYTEKMNMTSTAGAMTHQIYKANDCFAPRAAGHQPMSWNTWETLYNHYVVLGARVSVQFSPYSDNVSPGYCGIYLTDGSAAPYTVIQSYIEAKRGTYRALGTDGKTKHVGCKFSAKKFFNVTNVKDNLDRLGATVVGSPAELCYFDIWYSTADVSSASVHLMVTIDYIVSFSEPKDLAQSV